MKKIINGKLYDTSKASCIADECKSLHDFYKTSEALYRTAKGQWFIHGESSAGGTYGTADGRNCSSGEDIWLLSPNDAALWAEKAEISSQEQEAIAALLGIEEG